MSSHITFIAWVDEVQQGYEDKSDAALIVKVNINPVLLNYKSFLSQKPWKVCELDSCIVPFRAAALFHLMRELINGGTDFTKEKFEKDFVPYVQHSVDKANILANSLLLLIKARITRTHDSYLAIKQSPKALRNKSFLKYFYKIIDKRFLCKPSTALFSCSLFFSLNN